jgi:hypothetical protein
MAKREVVDTPDPVGGWERRYIEDGEHIIPDDEKTFEEEANYFLAGVDVDDPTGVDLSDPDVIPMPKKAMNMRDLTEEEFQLMLSYAPPGIQKYLLEFRKMGQI